MLLGMPLEKCYFRPKTDIKMGFEAQNDHFWSKNDLFRNLRFQKWPKSPWFTRILTTNDQFFKKLIFIFRFYVDVIIFEWSSFFQIQIDRKNPIGIKTVS